MKIASIQEIKSELENLPAKDVKQLCLRLARFKKENKELLTYILFESNDPDGYVNLVKTEIDTAFEDLPKANVYLTKKSLRKLLRSLGKYIKHMGSSEYEIEILYYFTKKLRASGIPIRRTLALTSIYESQLRKITKAIAGLHEDLQYDYLKKLSELE